MVIALVFAVAAQANWDDTPTGIDLNKLPHPALTRVRAGLLKAGERITFDGISATARELQGKGKSGTPWTVRLCDGCFDEVWRADLDGNGTLDYMILGANPYGRGQRTDAPYALSFLLMDSGGMPVPFFTTIYHREPQKHLITVDGQIRLVVSAYDELPSNPLVGPYCSGHWVTQIYRFSNTAVEEVRGTVAGRRFPLVHNWTYDGPECTSHPIGGVIDAKIEEIGTGPTGALFTKFAPGISPFAIEPVGGCGVVPSVMIMFDTKKSREIILPTQESDVQGRMVERITAAGASVELRGVVDCFATLLWAKPGRLSP